MFFRPKVGRWVVLKPQKTYKGLQDATAYEVVRRSESQPSFIHVRIPEAKYLAKIHKRDVRYATSGEVEEAQHCNALCRIVNNAVVPRMERTAR